MASLLPPRLSTTVGALLAQPRVAAVLGPALHPEALDGRISHPRVQKNGLVLAGHFGGFVASRVQVFGETELSFLCGLPEDVARERLTTLCAAAPCLLVVTRGVEVPASLARAAAETRTPLRVSEVRSSATIAALHEGLDRLLAPTEELHGVMVEIHGIGTLLLGPSGIGKSECALFLVERGHRLVADDRVRLTRLPNGQVRAAPAPLLEHHLEIRGLGILNVREMFGATSVWDEAVVDLVAELCPWSAEEEYERLGLDTHTESLLGVSVPKLRIPVRPGRNMAVILEVAARNQLLKEAGHHAARDFARRLSRQLGLDEPE
jgi:HPr kinase/phosphorylase